MIEWYSFFCGMGVLLFFQVCLAIFILKVCSRKRKYGERDEETIKEVLEEYTNARRSK